MPETGALYEALSPDEYLELMSCLYHLDPKSARSRREELLDLFGLLEVKDQRMTEFSKGMKQKIVIAAALMHRPDVLFLDEPLDGLDANAALLVKVLLKKLADQAKRCCSVPTSSGRRTDLHPRIVIINNGGR